MAALVGGLLGSQLGPYEIRAELPWYPSVLVPESDEQILELSGALTTVRTALSVFLSGSELEP